MAGRISLLIDSPLRDLLLVMRAVPAEANKKAMAFARGEAQPIWFDELRSRAGTRLEQRVLVDSGSVGVQSRQIVLRSGGVGVLSSGTDVSILKGSAEFGAPEAKPIQSTSRRGKAYTRRLGGAFRAPNRGGNIVFPAFRDATARVVSVIIQSYMRELRDALDGKK